MYRTRFSFRHFVVDDVNNLTVDQLPADIDLVTASFPCIDLSLAGNRAGLAGEHSGTVWPFLKLLENVTGFLSSRGGKDLAEVCRFLAKLGYAIDLAVVDARWFTPQSRPRLFAMAVRKEDAANQWPLSAGAPPSRVRPRSVRDFQQANPGLPFVELPLPEPPRQAPSKLSSILEDLSADDERWWPDEQTTVLLHNMAPRHRQRVAGLLDGRRDGVATLYRRRHDRTVGEVRDDEIAGCLRTPQGGSSVQFLVDCRGGKPRIRPLTGREYARLQGAEHFPFTLATGKPAWDSETRCAHRPCAGWRNTRSGMFLEQLCGEIRKWPCLSKRLRMPPAECLLRMSGLGLCAQGGVSYRRASH